MQAKNVLSGIGNGVKYTFYTAFAASWLFAVGTLGYHGYKRVIQPVMRYDSIRELEHQIIQKYGDKDGINGVSPEEKHTLFSEIFNKDGVTYSRGCPRYENGARVSLIDIQRSFLEFDKKMSGIESKL